MLRRIISKYIADVKRATTPGSFNIAEELTLWDFTKRESLQHWTCRCDEEIDGHSKAKFEPNGEGLTCCCVLV